MKKQILIFLITVSSINCYSQISFEKGYYINDADQKVDCLIKNVDWKNNPTEFEYKLQENSDEEKLTINTVKEFGIYDMSKYERHKVEIDRSSDDISKMSKVRKVQFQEEELFLKVLVEGKATLYSFEDGNLKRFFYSKDDSKVEQLVFKKYLSSDNKIGSNNRYKQQLWNSLKCPDFNRSKVEDVNYNTRELIKFFINYNKCENVDFTNFEEKQDRDLFNLSIRPGFNQASLFRNSSSSFRGVDFGNEFGFRVGLEAEFILPFNKNKWSLLLEPTWQYFKSKSKRTSQASAVEYTAIEVPVGVRYYIFLREKSAIFINGLLVFAFSDDSFNDYNGPVRSDLDISNNRAFGLGYEYNSKYSLELRYQTGRRVIARQVFLTSEYNTISIILGYSFL